MSVEEQVRDYLEDTEQGDLIDWLSDGEGEDFDALEPPIQADETFPTTLFISNVPKVGKEKYDKLMNVLGKSMDKIGKNEKYMPLNEKTGQTDGFIIVTFESKEVADKAAEVLDGKKLDITHTYKVVKMDAFDSITSRSEEFVPVRTLKTFPRGDFRLWLQDPKCREQLLLRYQNETEIYWHDTLAGQPVLCYGGEREKAGGKIWCDWRVQWSPMGSYLATFHKQGVQLWAGPDFKSKVRLPHNGPQKISFSPNEDYVLTWNGHLATENDEDAVRIFRVLTGECMRKSRTPAVAPLGGDFPHFLWSPDGQFIAECKTLARAAPPEGDGGLETTITVRETETFELIKDSQGKKKTIKYDGEATFQWSPKDNVIAIWILEKGNNPARLVLVEVPSRIELASRARTQVKASMHWQSEGDYLCLLVTKLTKTKKDGTTNLEIFRIRDKNYPVDIVEVKDIVTGFFWETRGSRFAVLTTDEQGHHPRLLIYGLGAEKCEQICSFDLPSNSFNSVFWAPDGQYFIVAALGQGDLLFGGITSDNKLEILHKDEHFMLTEVTWDPSSRYVITAVTQPMETKSDMGYLKYSMEAGYAIWSFQGRLLFRQQKEKLWAVNWRPHPPSLLPKKKQEDIRKNIKTFSKKYDALDESSKEAARQAFRAERDEKTSAFKEILDRLNEYKEEQMQENGWAEAWEAHAESQGWEMSESIVEEELDVTEELISG